MAYAPFAATLVVYDAEAGLAGAVEAEGMRCVVAPTIMHGTAEAANIFSCAPNIDFIGVKWGINATLAFKAASDLEPGVMTNSWGYHLPGLTTLPNFLKPLEAAVLEAVILRGIIVCFSAGNGHIAFPAMMPDVLAVGGVHARANLVGNDFFLEASNYASSFDSLIYPGRHVPDVCGLVGMQPGALYIMLPVPPGSAIDVGVSGGTHPNGDETSPNDGWAAISGTSSTSKKQSTLVRRNSSSAGTWTGSCPVRTTGSRWRAGCGMASSRATTASRRDPVRTARPAQDLRTPPWPTRSRARCRPGHSLRCHHRDEEPEASELGPLRRGESRFICRADARYRRACRRVIFFCASNPPANSCGR